MSELFLAAAGEAPDGVDDEDGSLSAGAVAS